MDAGNKSEVARLLRQIELEYEAAQRGLTGLAFGTARHDFITAKMERMQQCQEQLGHLIGMREATQLVAERLDQVPDAQKEHVAPQETRTLMNFDNRKR